MEPGGSGLGVHPSCASKIVGAWLEAGWCRASTNIGIGIDINIWVGTLGEAVCSVLVFSTQYLEEVGHGAALCSKFCATAACANCRYLHENSLDGKIPSELGMLKKLTDV